MRRTPILTAATAIVAALAISAPAKAVPVDLELSLVIDVSGSVNTSEYNLMMDGYANAFRNATIQSAILGGTNGGIAVNVVFFASSATEGITFTHLNSEAAIDAFADALDLFARPGGIGSGTNISAGMNLAAMLLVGDNGFESDRQVMDVSGDGSGGASVAARDAALAAGVDVINGIVIESMSVFTTYQNSVIGGTGAFALFATDFEAFEDGIAEKLAIEVGADPTPGIPEPGTLALFGLGLAGLGFARRRRAS